MKSNLLKLQQDSDYQIALLIQTEWKLDKGEITWEDVDYCTCYWAGHLFMKFRGGTWFID